MIPRIRYIGFIHRAIMYRFKRDVNLLTRRLEDPIVGGRGSIHPFDIERNSALARTAFPVRRCPRIDRYVGSLPQAR